MHYQGDRSNWEEQEWGTSIPDLRVAMLFSSSKRKSQEIAKKIVPSSLVESL